MNKPDDCEKCDNLGYYYDLIDRDPIEGYKLATPKTCQCYFGVNRTSNINKNRILNLLPKLNEHDLREIKNTIEKM